MFNFLSLKKLAFNFLIYCSLSTLHIDISYALASESQTNLLKNTILIVGSEQSFPPFSTGMTDETAGGFTVDLWKVVATETDLNYKIRVMPFHQLLEEFKNGEIDVLINLAQSDERKKFADFTVPHSAVSGAIFVRKGTNSVNSETDLVDKSIIVLNSDLAHDYAISKGWGKQLVLVDTVNKGLSLLASGQHDAMLISKLSGLQTLQSSNLTNIKVLKAPVHFSQKFSFAVQKGQAELLSILNEGLAIAKSNNIYTSIYEKWFGVYELKEPDIYQTLKYAIPPIIFLLILSLYFYISRHLERKKSLEQMKISAIAFESHEGIIVTDANKIIIRVNQSFLKITGFTAEEAIGQPISLLDPEHQSEALSDAIWEKINHVGFWEGEVFSQHKNNSIYPEHRTITAVRNSHLETLNFVVIFNDISDNKKIEEQRLRDEVMYRDALVREVHHRIKNNLQGVIILMSNMAVNSPELTSQMNKAISKVNSISIVHGLQGERASNQITVVDLINAMIDNNKRLFDCEITFQISNDILTILIVEEEAVPTALILNELLLNAIKHREKSTSISIDIHYDSTQEMLSIQIKNSGRFVKDSSLEQPEFGAGLQLANSLKPKKNMTLSWHQENNYVITTITLTYPIIKTSSAL